MGIEQGQPGGDKFPDDISLDELARRALAGEGKHDGDLSGLRDSMADPAAVQEVAKAKANMQRVAAEGLGPDAIRAAMDAEMARFADEGNPHHY